MKIRKNNNYYGCKQNFAGFSQTISYSAQYFISDVVRKMLENTYLW